MFNWLFGNKKSDKAWAEYKHATEEYSTVITALNSQLDNMLAVNKLHQSFLDVAKTAEDLEYYKKCLAPKYEIERAFYNQLVAIANNKLSVVIEKKKAIFDE